jgi:hypothetical protein
MLKMKPRRPRASSRRKKVSPKRGTSVAGLSKRKAPSPGMKAKSAKRTKASGRPIPQEVLLYAAKTFPTPDIFNDVPNSMPFPTE